LGVQRCELPPEGREPSEDNRGVMPACRCGDAPVSVQPVLEVDQEGGECRHRGGRGRGGKPRSRPKGETVLCTERADRRVAGRIDPLTTPGEVTLQLGQERAVAVVHMPAGGMRPCDALRGASPPAADRVLSLPLLLEPGGESLQIRAGGFRLIHRLGTVACERGLEHTALLCRMTRYKGRQSYAVRSSVSVGTTLCYKEHYCRQ
jgi:hypothetical protein